MQIGIWKEVGCISDEEDGQAAQSFCSPKFLLLNSEQFNPYAAPHCVRMVARPRPPPILLYCVKVLLSNRARVPERLLHPWPCDQDSPVHMQAYVCSTPPPSIPEPPPLLMLPRSRVPASPSLRHFRLRCMWSAFLEHEGYNLFRLEAGQFRCSVPGWVLSFSCVN